MTRNKRERDVIEMTYINCIMLYNCDCMKQRGLLILMLALGLSNEPLFGQIFISSGKAYSHTTDINVHVFDESKTGSIQGATVYLCHYCDSTVVAFAISDSSGDARLKGIPKGRYDIYVELLGYKAHKQTIIINTAPRIAIEVFLAVDSELIEAAQVTGFVKPIEQIGDTLVFNATAFRTGGTDVLRDLLRKVPGVSIEEGRVYVNGQQVTELTVNGRTFFFGDMNVTLSTLPARIINRIKVVDKNTDLKASEISATNSGDERIMDVEIKEEYAKGGFGNCSVGFGVGRSNSPEHKRDLDKGVCDLTAAASLYDKSRQWTSLLNVDNESAGQGWGAKIGTNYLTFALKPFDLSLSAISSANCSDEKAMEDRNEILSTREVVNTSSNRIAEKKDRIIRLESELKSRPAKNGSSYRIRSFLSLSDEKYNSITHSTMILNDSTSQGIASNNTFFSKAVFGINIDGHIDSIGKDGRMLKYRLKYKGNNDKGTERVMTAVEDELGLPSLNMDSRNKLDYGQYEAFITYVEPISKRLSLETTSEVVGNYSRTEKESKDLLSGEISPAYSLIVNNNDIDIVENLYATVHFDNDINLSIGGRGECYSNTTMTSLAVGSKTVGRGSWHSRISPYFFLRQGTRVFWVGVSPISPSREDIQPGFTYISHTERKIGNIYLKPAYRYSLKLQYNYYKKTLLNFIVESNIDKSSFAIASWGDKQGTRHTMVVNANKPTYDVSSFVSISRSFCKEGKLSLSFHSMGHFYSDISYVNRGYIPMEEYKTFVYIDYMDQLWGNERGDRFYIGDSGFESFNSRIATLDSRFRALYRGEKFSASLEITPKFYMSAFDCSVLRGGVAKQCSIAPNFEYYFSEKLSIDTSLKHEIYKGFGDRYDTSVNIWDLELSREFGLFSVAVGAYDILDQTRKIVYYAAPDHTNSLQYNAIGRIIKMSISYNFGKSLNTSKRRADEFLRKYSN